MKPFYKVELSKSGRYFYITIGDDASTPLMDKKQAEEMVKSLVSHGQNVDDDQLRLSIGLC